MKKRLRMLVYKFICSGPHDMAWDHLSDVNCLMCDMDATKFRPRAPRDYIVNWGVIKYPTNDPGWQNLPAERFLNRPHLVLASGNRLKALPKMKEAGVNVPEYTTQFDVAAGWLGDGHGVLARKNNRSRSGHGVSYITEVDKLPTGCALYVRYQPKKDEYRVHIFRGKVIDVQQKKQRLDFPKDKVDHKIRSYDNGWVFCRDGIVPPTEVTEQSRRAVLALGLDFGATDVGWNEKKQQAMVYEVNSAPGLKGTTIIKYADAIRNWYKGQA